MKVPALPMIRILQQYAYANKIPLRTNRPDELILLFEHYCNNCKKLN